MANSGNGSVMRAVLNIDVSEVKDLYEGLAEGLTNEEAKKMLTRALKRTATHVRQMAAEEVADDYFISKAMVKKHMGPTQIQFGANGADVSAGIPLRGHRLSIGGKGKGGINGFSASGGAHGWKALSLRKRYKVKAKVVQAVGQSILPTEMDGGYTDVKNAPFRNFDAKVLNGVTFVREKQSRLPIRKVMGIAVPQMPMNRSADDIQENTVNFLMERMEHEYDYIIGNIRKR